jgi:hypothetical protein
LDTHERASILDIHNPPDAWGRHFLNCFIEYCFKIKSNTNFFFHVLHLRCKRSCEISRFDVLLHLRKGILIDAVFIFMRMFKKTWLKSSIIIITIYLILQPVAVGAIRLDRQRLNVNFAFMYPAWVNKPATVKSVK